MLMLFGPCPMDWLDVMGETGVNGAFAAVGLKLWNSDFMENVEAGENPGDISWPNGLPLLLLWKPLLASKGLNWGQNMELLSDVKGVVWSVIILLNKVALKF